MKKVDIDKLNYKNPEYLRNFVNQQGMILPRKVTRMQLKEQKKLTQAVKRARHLALLPFTQTL